MFLNIYKITMKKIIWKLYRVYLETLSMQIMIFNVIHFFKESLQHIETVLICA